MINMIWAMDESNLVGKNNQIPWHIKEDLLYYKSKTKGKTVLMGDNTYYSLKGYYKDKPLPYGKIYVASMANLELEDATVISDLVSFVKDYPLEEELWVCGGATIYKLCLPYANRLYISFIKGVHEGDAYFPQIDYNNYDLEWENITDKVRYTIYKRK